MDKDSAARQAKSAELKTSARKYLNLITIDSRIGMDDMKTCQDFCTKSRLLRVTTQVLRAVRMFKHLIQKSDTIDTIDTSTTITTEELAEAVDP